MQAFRFKERKDERC